MTPDPLALSSTAGAPHDRLMSLCDPGSLRQLAQGPRGRSAGVVAATGRVAGRPIVCYAHDQGRAGGSVGVAEGELVVRALKQAYRSRAPLVAFLASAGARLQEGAAALGAFARIFSENVRLTRHVPQISVITGTSAGGGCYSPALTDFIVMTRESAMFLTGPQVVREALGEEVATNQLGGVRVHERNGVCQFVAANDLEANAIVRELLGLLPQQAGGPAPRLLATPPPDGEIAAEVPSNPRHVYDVRHVARRLVDGGRLLEVSPRWGRNLVAALARLEGQPVAIVANQPRHLGGTIDTVAAEKGARFIDTCDALGLPLLVLVDTPGFLPGAQQEAAGVIRLGARLLRAFAAAEVPRLTVVLRKAYGGAYITMNSKDLGADRVFAWPGAEIGIMGPGSAVRIIHRRELERAPGDLGLGDRLAAEYAARHLSVQQALDLGLVDAVIEPEETRARLVGALGDVAARRQESWSVRRTPLRSPARR